MTLSTESPPTESSPQEQKPAHKHSSSNTWLERPTKVLVAEDEHLLARNIEMGLSKLGFTVVAVTSNGLDAVEAAKKYRPDMVLMDIRMPEMDGLTASKLIYEAIDRPIVLVTAHSDPQYVEDTIDSGIYGYLLKPVGLDELRVGMIIAWQRFVGHQLLHGEVNRLERKIEERKIIEKAKGILMHNLGMSEPEAMRRLQKQARDGRRPMVDLAQALVDADSLLKKT